MRGYSIEQWPLIEQNMDLTIAFIRTNNAIGSFVDSPTKEGYIAIWEHYSTIAYNLGFSLGDIIRAYIAKNEKNYERQRTGY